MTVEIMNAGKGANLNGDELLDRLPKTGEQIAEDLRRYIEQNDAHIVQLQASIAETEAGILEARQVIKELTTANKTSRQALNALDPPKKKAKKNPGPGTKAGGKRKK